MTRGPRRIQATAVVCLTCLLVPLAHSEEPPAKAPVYFPPGVFFPKAPDLSDFSAEHLGKRLKALGEPSLWERSKSGETFEALRFFWWPYPGRPLAIRVEKSGGDVRLHFVEYEQAGLNAADKITQKRDFPLTREDWDQLKLLFDASHFWTAPTTVKETRGFGDGDLLLLECAEKGKYHVIDRLGSVANEAYYAICRKMFELAKLDALPRWDSLREDTRKSSHYMPVYPEIPDLGEEEVLEKDHFPPDAFIAKNQELNDNFAEPYLYQLKLSEEPSLWKRAKADPALEAFRLLWMPPTNSHVVVSVEKTGNEIRLRFVEFKWLNGLSIGKITRKTNVPLTREQWDQLSALIDKTKFWTAPPVVVDERDDFESTDSVLIEGTKKGKHHLIERNGVVMSETYKSVCRQLLQLAQPDTLPNWDQYRDADRRRPGYKAEYPDAPYVAPKEGDGPLK